MISSVVRLENPPIFTIFKKLMPTITGIAKKKENSAAATVERPATHPPIIVEAERDIPGIMASTWKEPIISACFTVTFSSSPPPPSLLFLNFDSA
ncbi:hypothetical protein D3C81_1773620 [compost metagenome]